MKKILVVLLALTCAFAMFSCGNSASVKDFNKAIENTNPTAIEVDITSDTAFGALKASFVTTYAEDGSFTVEGFYEKFNAITEGNAEDLISAVNVNITCDKDGKYSDGGSFTGSNPVATGAVLNLNKKIDADVSADGNVLTATVKAENTEAVLGIEYAADVELVITVNDGKVVSYTMKYATDYGYDTIICSYK